MENKGSHHLLREEFLLFGFQIEIKQGCSILYVLLGIIYIWRFQNRNPPAANQAGTPSLQLDTRGQNDTTLRMSNRVKL